MGPAARAARPRPAGRAGTHPTAAQRATFDRVSRTAALLDARFRIPGTAMRVGLDGLFGLIPGIGDTAMLVASAYIVIEAGRAGVRRRVLARMVANIVIDYVIGLVPLVGDLFDFAWKANLRNIRLMAEDLGLDTADRR